MGRQKYNRREQVRWSAGLSRAHVCLLRILSGLPGAKPAGLSESVGMTTTPSSLVLCEPVSHTLNPISTSLPAFHPPWWKRYLHRSCLCALRRRKTQVNSERLSVASSALMKSTALKRRYDCSRCWLLSKCLRLSAPKSLSWSLSCRRCAV